MQPGRKKRRERNGVVYVRRRKGSGLNSNTVIMLGIGLRTVKHEVLKFKIDVSAARLSP